MGVDAKGFVATQCKDVFLVTSLVESALKSLIIQELRRLYGDDKVMFRKQEAYTTYIKTRINSSTESVTFDFKFNDEERSLRAFFTCDCDHEDVTPQSLSFILGCWGSSPLLMQQVLFAMSLLGQAYYDENDCDAIDAAPTPTPEINFLDAINLGFVSEVKFKDWVNVWKRGDINTKRSFEDFFGMSEASAEDLLAQNYKLRWDFLKNLAQKRLETTGAIVPYFMEQHLKQVSKQVK